MITAFTKHELAILAYELKRDGMLPLDGLRVYLDERSERVPFWAVDFVKGDKQMKVQLLSRHGQEYDTEALEKQLTRYFIKKEVNNGTK